MDANYFFYPFYDHLCSPPRPAVVPTAARKTPSKISDMTVGDVRHCFAQIRSNARLASSSILWCGMSAGDFALQYILHHTFMSKKKKRVKVSAAACS
jgi:hypothetical protein